MSEVFSILALDVGERRIGVALANSIAQIASPLTTLSNTNDVLDEIVRLVNEHNVRELAIGLPRNMQSEDTDQTRYVRDFAASLKLKLPSIQLYFQDEAATSVVAESRLKHRGSYRREDIDAEAAAIILEDFLREASHVNQI